MWPSKQPPTGHTLAHFILATVLEGDFIYKSHFIHQKTETQARWQLAQVPSITDKWRANIETRSKCFHHRLKYLPISCRKIYKDAPDPVTFGRAPPLLGVWLTWTSGWMSGTAVDSSPAGASASPYRPSQEGRNVLINVQINSLKRNSLLIWFSSITVYIQYYFVVLSGVQHSV